MLLYNHKEIEFGVLGDLPYSIWQHSLGHLCGYVGVPRSHPWYGLFCDNIDVRVHGGLTYCGEELPKRNRLKPYPHDTRLAIWWIGFDCAHAGDLVPGSRLRGGVYRDRDYVFKQIERLVEQVVVELQKCNR